MRPILLTYDKLYEIQVWWETETGHNFSKCTCLDCLDQEGPLSCSSVFDMYNFDGDCLEWK